MRFLFFSFAGRIGRGKFWIGTLVLLAIYVIVYGALIYFGEEDFLATPSALWIRLTTAALDTLLLWPTFAVTAKRQQDRGQWPWLAWFGLLLTVTMTLIDLAGKLDVMLETTIGLAITGIVGIAYVLLILIELGMRRGTPGANRYGPDPLQA